MRPSPNHALHRTRPSRSGCNRGVPRAGSLSLGHSSDRSLAIRTSDLKTWLSSTACPYCKETFGDASFHDLDRTGGPRFRCLPPRPECWKFNCPSCNRRVVVCTRLRKTWLIGTGTVAAMVNPISVNDAIDRLPELSGQIVSVFGSLSLDFEGTCINHIPKTESRDDETGTYQSSIWVNFDLAAIKQREHWLDQFDGRHVRVAGRLAAPLKGYGGCGHFSMWPAELNVTAIEKH
jgi:hypothetical protein